MAIKPIPIKNLQAHFKKAAVTSDINTSGSLDSKNEINMAAIKVKLHNPEKYTEFVKLSEKHGYDLKGFPVNDYVKVIRDEVCSAVKLLDRDIPKIKTSIFLNEEDKGKDYREKLKIQTAPRKVTTHGLFLKDVEEENAVLHFTHTYKIKGRKGKYYATSKIYSLDQNPHGILSAMKPEFRPEKITEESISTTIKLIEKAQKSIRFDTSQRKLLNDLNKVKLYIIENYQ